MLLKLNGTHQLLVYANDLNLLEDNTNVGKNNKYFDASKEVGVQVNTKKSMYMFLPHHQNIGQLL
jgi:hypothetical protein